MLTVDHDGHHFQFQHVEAADQVIYNLYIDGGMDSTFTVAVPASFTMAMHQMLPDQLQVDPVLVVGDHSNLKVQIIAAEVAKMVIIHKQKPVVLSLGSKWFGRDLADGDFDRLMWVLGQVKADLSSR